MKICFCDNRLGGLLGFRSEIIRHFAANGHEVVLLVPRPTTNWDKVGRADIPNIRVEYIEMDANGQNPIADTKLLFHYYQFFRAERPDILFTYTIKPNIYAGLAAQWLHIRYVSVIAGLGYAFEGSCLFKRTLRLLYHIGVKKAQQVLVLNSSNYDTLLTSHFVRKEQLHLLEGGEGIDLEAYPYRESDYSHGITFLMVSRILYAKGYSEFIEAAKRVKASHPEVRFEMLGPLDETSPMRVPLDVFNADCKSDIFQYLGVSNRVAEIVGRPDVVIVLPSNYAEGLNRSLMEACSIGRPIITTRIPGCQEIVEENKNGYLVPPKDGVALAHAIEQFIALPEETKRAMAAHSHSLAEERFDVKRVIALYNQLL